MVIHGLVLHTIIIEMRRDLQRARLGVRLWVNLTFVTGTTLLVLAGHILEVALWAFVFDYVVRSPIFGASALLRASGLRLKHDADGAVRLACRINSGRLLRVRTLIRSYGSRRIVWFRRDCPRDRAPDWRERVPVASPR